MFVQHNRRVFAPDDGTGSGSPAPDATGTNGSGTTVPAGGAAPNPAPQSPNWDEFIGGLRDLSSSLGSKLDDLNGQVKTLPAALTPAPAPAAPPDYESMSRPELVAHIVGTVQERLKSEITAALRPLSDQLNSVQTSVTTRDVTQSIEKMRETKKDFADWKDDMVGLAKQHPTLDIPSLYALARANNPTRAGDLDKKYAPPAPPAPPRFGAILGGSANGVAAKALSPADASVEAYREVQARHPNVLAALEGM